MKITICGSIGFYDQMVEVADKLRKMGHEVELPPSHIKDDNGDMIPVQEYYKKRKAASPNDDSWIWDVKRHSMMVHFDKVLWCDAILVLNYDKNEIKNYIGPNTFLEMGVAMHKGKKVFLLNDVPEMNYTEEIVVMDPVVVGENLNKII